MNTFWLKLAAVVVLIVVVIVVISRFTGSKQGQQEQLAKQEKTVGDVWREDEKRLRAEPNVSPASGIEQVTSARPTEEPATKFRQLTEEEQAGAEQLFEMAIAQRKMARLPGMSYGQMVNYCRQIIERYPGSEFEYKARRMLGEVPREQWERYRITKQEIDGSQR
jgi:hypothetical protein